MLRWSALLGATEALMGGTTAIIDHHESPAAIEGSLSVIAEACAEVGVRVATAYGVTDRWDDQGRLQEDDWPPPKMTDAARRGLAENERFLRDGGRGMVGVHAAFTCSDDTLAAAAGLAERPRRGCPRPRRRGHRRPRRRRPLAGLARDDWLLVHCVHLDRDLPGTIAHNPRSNMSNGVGYARPAARPNPIVLGTDGIGADMLEEARLAYARLREDDVEASADVPWDWLATGQRWFPEVAGDRVTWSYDYADSPWHVAFTPGVRALRVEVDGEVLLDDGRPTRVDVAEVRAKAAEQATRLHARL